jgi:hypothetical protein
MRSDGAGKIVCGGGRRHAAGLPGEHSESRFEALDMGRCRRVRR